MIKRALKMQIRSPGKRNVQKINKCDCIGGGGGGFSLKSQLNTNISKDP